MNKRACRGQSVRSSEEASNDRGAKGRRKAVLGARLRPSHQGRRSAARLSASVRRRATWPRFVCWQWAARNRVSGSNGDCAAGVFPPSIREQEPEPAHRGTADWKAGCGRSACPVWEGGGALRAPPILIQARARSPLHCYRSGSFILASPRIQVKMMGSRSWGKEEKAIESPGKGPF
jgi:hypothetical protein